jgi:carboxyl-terminal processing protease
MKRSLIRSLAVVLTVAATGLASALASPAQDLFDQATFYLEFNYFGFSKVNPASFSEKYQPKLNEACATQKETCPYDVAVPLIEEMVKELGDDHTGYQSPDSYQAYLAQRAGQGNPAPRLGFRFRVLEDKSRQVLRARDDGPAFAAGLRRGDIVLGFNAKKFADQKDTALSEAIAAGENVTLNVKRGNQNLDFTAKGIIFQTAELASMEIDAKGIANIYMPDFTPVPQTAVRMNELVQKAITAKAKAIILDLRDNGGGAVTNLMAVAGIFLPEAQVQQILTERYSSDRIFSYRNGNVYVKDSASGEEQVAYKSNPVKWDGPLTVLINGEAGSAPEYIANMLQYAKRATVIGEPSFGVGNTANRTLPLINGGGFTITIGKSLRFDRTPFPERVTPDVLVKDDLDEFARTGRDLILEKAYELLGL